MAPSSGIAVNHQREGTGFVTSGIFSYRDDPDVPEFPDDKPLIVFDGICVLCSGSARFVLRHDAVGRFRLTAAQSPLGQALYRHLGLPPTHLDTFLLVDGGRVFLKSDAALRVAAQLGPPWTMASVFRALPRAARDVTYDWVARNRYRLFGKRDTCFVPNPDQAARFL